MKVAPFCAVKNAIMGNRWNSKIRKETILYDGTPTDFTIIENFSILDLDEEYISHHSGLHPRQFNFVRSCQVQEAAVNAIVFIIASSFDEIYRVFMSFAEAENNLFLTCDCEIDEDLICTHQAMSMYNFLGRTILHPFFYPEKRRIAFKTSAVKYGLNEIENLDEFFDLEFHLGQVKVKSKKKELLRLDDKGKSDLNRFLLPKKNVFDEKEIIQLQKESLRGIVFSENVYRHEMNVQIFDAKLTGTGKPKNPLDMVDPNLEMQATDASEELKFFSAVAFFKGVYQRDDDITSQLKALKGVLKNPQKLPYYLVGADGSNSISAKTIQRRHIHFDSRAYVSLEIKQKGEFYEIIPFLNHNDRKLEFKSLKLKLQFFFDIEGELYALEGENKYKLFSFFKEYNHRLLISVSQYEEFHKEYLAPLEEDVQIDYAFKKKASKKQIAKFIKSAGSKKTIYLSESENYILITPAIRYGKMEVPVLSQKQLSGLDEVGEWYSIPRDKKMEDKFLGMLIRQHEEFEEQLGGFDHFYLHKKKFYNEGWFADAFSVWADEEVEVMGFRELKKNNWNPAKISVTINVSSGLDWFDTSIKLNFADEQVTLQQVQKAIRNQSNYVVLGDGSHGLLPEEWIAKFSAYFRSGDVVEDKIRIAKVNYSIINELFEEEMIDNQVFTEIENLKEQIKNFKNIKKVKVPKALNAALRDYQKDGLNWLHFLDEFNFGGCLADDMGLGKTIQIIAFIVSLKEKGKDRTHLVIVPTSLLFNWTREIEKFAPTLRILTNYGQTRAKNTNDFPHYDIVLTTYGTLLSDVHKLKKFPFDYIFLDESQAIKNPQSMRYKASRLLQSRNRVVLTGTPIENNTFDLFAQFSFAVPGIFGSVKHFRDEYSTPIDKFKDFGRAKELQEKINPFLLRRTKKQVAKELPEKTEMVLYCEMGEEQRAVYDSQRTEIRDSLLSRDRKEFDINKSMLLLAGLTKLRQICDTPKILPDDLDYGAESAKMTVLLEEIRNKHKHHKILVFSQFVTMLDLIRIELDKEEISHEYLTGKSKKRQEIVHRFQNDEEVRVFLISLKAGGTGLNLTEADYVYIVDPWWNPAVENQAIDRSYRIGQKKNVVAVRLICPDTIEDKIMTLQESKRELAEDLVRTDASVLKSLSKSDLVSLFE